MEDARRVRSLSTSTSCTELEAESLGPEAAPSYLLLLDICHGCLALLSSLSPPLPDLLAGSALHDPDKWEPLLLQSFSPPTLEQDGDTPSYGLLLALANVAVRGAAREAGGARSPSPSSRNCTASPGRPASAPPPDSIERRRLGLVLERVTTLLLEQALLSLAVGNDQTREQQLLRRELGAELSAITDTWRRHLVRGRSPGRGRSPAPPPSSRAKSPAGLSAPVSPSPAASRCGRPDQDAFMKFVSNLVHNMFK